MRPEADPLQPRAEGLTCRRFGELNMTTPNRDDLITNSLPLINHVAHRVAVRLPPSVEILDLVSAGVIGLLDAVEKFEPDRGVKFKTYAELRIRGAMLDSLRDLDWAPRSLRKKSKDLEKVYANLEQRLGRPATDEEVCAELGGDMDAFHALVDQLNGLTIGSFEDLGGSQDGKDSFIDYYANEDDVDPYHQFERDELTQLLADVIDELPERERLVLSLYYYENFTMKEIRTMIGVNDSRVSQIHSKTMLRLRSKLKKAVPTADSVAELLSNS
jgi:RNA polymerase sigma factor for flagellar operon FliA